MVSEVKIIKLEYPENIRTRMGMYGASGNADILYRELVDNSIDIATKFNLSISVKSVINQNNWNFITDNGIGLPVYTDKDIADKEQPILIDMMSKINTGSNFHKTEYSTGMNGVGSRLTQALSEYFIIITNVAKKDITTIPKFMQKEVKRGNSLLAYVASRGKLLHYEMISKKSIKSWLSENYVEFTEKSEKFIDSIDIESMGVLWAFKPDSILLDDTHVTYEAYPFKLAGGLFQYDMDFSKIQVSLDLNGKTIEPFNFKKEYADIQFIEDKIFTVTADIKTLEPKSIKFIVQFGYDKSSFGTKTDGSVNLLITPTGKHINLVTQALGIALNKFNAMVRPSDAKLGLVSFILNFALEPSFNSQDKTNLSRYEDKGATDNLIKNELVKVFSKIIKKDQEYFRLICERIIQYRKATDKLSNIELLKSSFVMGKGDNQKRAQQGIAAQVYECSSKFWEQRELYITEGKSASSNLVQARNKEYQSVLPLRGKLINTAKLDEIKLVANSEVLAIFNTIGCGAGSIFDITQSRYGKIIIAVDSDDDGSHIANLISGLFYYHAPELIRQGKVYKLESPFYKWEYENKTKYYFSNEKDLIDFSKGKVTKMKGLGSSSIEETKKYMTGNGRKLIQLKLNEDNEEKVYEATKLLYSTIERRQLMISHNIISGDL